MGDTEYTPPSPDDPGLLDHTFQALRVGATAPRPPSPPDCPFCDLPQDRYHTWYTGHWILLEPRIRLPAHTVPPSLRWIITPGGLATELGDAEPLPGTVCRIPHRVACPGLLPGDHWPWLTALRLHNDRRTRRLFDLPDEGLPDTG
ncbi:DUF6083 domain-containing protein [Streptomyces halstedii]|uniref:Uncharacterized protein n=1 Tax=Streptomyces halstedii TaxID=1944 RepID=A0A6N9U2G6_STRHA|nr:DUF6083 domain-containing protein [Streptomyces halstedii]NEA17994.1 hypothetical protein [Streptomyces halstedii]